MIPPIPNLQDYGLSENYGFLPNEVPLDHLSSCYYDPWENIAANLPVLAKTKRIRRAIDDLPLLDTFELKNEAEWRRAYVILGFLTHAYIWGGDEPSECLPPTISIPLLEISERFEIPPVATYATVVLWNYGSVSKGQSLDSLSNLRSITSFTGTRDEEWFYLVSVAIEARGAKSIPPMLKAMAAARENDSTTVVNSLLKFSKHINDLSELLARMYEECDPNVFYFRIRPFLAGSRNMEESGLPNGVLYEDGHGNKTYHKYSGGSNAQSSLIQTFDIILGVEHRPTGQHKDPSSEKLQGTAPPPQNSFIKEMRTYMPGPHRRFLEHLTTVANIRDYATLHKENKALSSAYDKALDALTNFRSTHVQIVTRYIIHPSTAEKRRVAAAAALSGSSPSTKRLSQAMALVETEEPRHGLARDEASKKGLRGTGGTKLIPFLKQARDETMEPALGVGMSIPKTIENFKRPTPKPRTPTDFAKSCNVNEFEDSVPGFVGLAGAWDWTDDVGGLCHS